MLTGDQNLHRHRLFGALEHPHAGALSVRARRSPTTPSARSPKARCARSISQVSLNDAMGDQRGEIEAQVAENMQRILDGYRSGVQIQGIAIKQADPPDAVNDAFKQVTAAQQDAQTLHQPGQRLCAAADARRRRARRPRSTRSMSNTSWRPESPGGACITRRWSRCCRRSTRRSSRRRASRLICRCRRSQKHAAAGAGAMIDFVRRRPIAVRDRSAFVLLLVLLSSFPIVPETKQAVVVRFGKPVRILNRYKPGQPIGGAGRRHHLAHSVRRADRVDRQARARRRHGSASRCCRPTSAGSRSTPSPATGSSIRC